MRALIITVAACMLTGTAAYAKDKDQITRLMNESEICTPLKFKLGDVADIRAIKLLPGVSDISIGIDKNAHEISSVEITDTSARIVGSVRCQPSSESDGLKLIGKKPEEFRITDNITCQAVLGNGQVTSINCEISGEIGKLLGKRFDIDEQMKQIIQASLG